MGAMLHIEPLSPRHLRQVQRIVARQPGAHGSPLQSTIDRDLVAAEARGGNLSIGIFRGRRLQGFLLALVEQGGGASQIRIASACAGRSSAESLRNLYGRLATNLLARDDLADAAILATVDLRMTGLLADARGGIHGTAFRIVAREGLSGEPQEQWHLRLEAPDSTRAPNLEAAMKLQRTCGSGVYPIKVGLIDNIADWELLEPYWDDLLRKTRGGTVFQSYEYLRSWWNHIGWTGDLWIVVAMRADRPVAIAPMQRLARRWLGQPIRSISFMGLAPESDRPSVLADPAEAEATAGIVEFLLEQRESWHRLVLHEQAPDAEFLRALLPRLRQARLLVACSDGPGCPEVSIRGSWGEYLSGRSSAFRKSLRRRLKRLATRGVVELDSGAAEGSDSNLERYLNIEKASWKHASRWVGVAQTSAHLSFYRELVRRHGSTLGVRYRFLVVGGQTIAATFGLLWQRRLYSLHVAHDDRWADHSPGVVLTAMELEQAFVERDFDVFDFLSGILPNKGSWATATVPSINVCIDRATLSRRAYHVLEFSIRPAIKRALQRAGLLPHALRLKERIRRAAGLEEY